MTVAMLTRKEWRLNPAVPAAGSLPERILAGRGLASPAEAASFLNPSLSQLHDPFLLPDMGTACAMIAGALAARQTITVFGDYDVDGITASVLLARFFRRLGADCLQMIPDRLADGYGLTGAGVARIIGSGNRLLITVDCGIASLAEIDQLNQAGIQTIVTDHHECQTELPAAAAVINPKRPDSAYPFRGLAGVGVALKLVQGLCQTLGLGAAWQDDLELAALGTVADVVPLLGENRVIVTSGLNLLPQKRHCGLAALCDAVGIADKQINAQTLGFVLAPRINAAGRMGDAAIALDLLMTDAPEQAALRAAVLADLNRQRQELEAAITAEAMREIDSQFDFASRDLIIVARDGWHHGVIGIVASRLAEQYCRPVIVLSGEDGIYRGSCRSWGDFDILAAIESAAAHAVKFGGHRKAAGLSVEAGRLADFCRSINDYARKTLQPDNLLPVLTAELEASPADLTLENALAIQQLSPFGEDNPQPLLIMRQLTLTSIRMAGNGRHLKLQMTGPDGRTVLDGIAFGLGEADDLFSAGEQIDVLFALEINSWMGRSSISLNIRDLVHCRANDEFRDYPWIADRFYHQLPDLKALMNRYSLPLQALRPDKAEYKSVYQYIRSKFGEQPVLADLSLLARRIAHSYRSDLNTFRLSRILSVFQETRLIDLQRIGQDRVRLTMLPAAARVRLEDSPTYQLLQAEEGIL